MRTGAGVGWNKTITSLDESGSAHVSGVGSLVAFVGFFYVKWFAAGRRQG